MGYSNSLDIAGQFAMALESFARAPELVSVDLEMGSVLMVQESGWEKIVLSHLVNVQRLSLMGPNQSVLPLIQSQVFNQEI
jgi:hypothetical protein